MNTMNVHHDEEGLLFRKYEAETGISYIEVPTPVPAEPLDIKGLLVRHGTVESGRCGYYPVSLLLANPGQRRLEAKRRGKRPPSEHWVRRTAELLTEKGLAFN